MIGEFISTERLCPGFLFAASRTVQPNVPPPALPHLSPSALSSLTLLFFLSLLQLSCSSTTTPSTPGLQSHTNTRQNLYSSPWPLPGIASSAAQACCCEILRPIVIINPAARPLITFFGHHPHPQSHHYHVENPEERPDSPAGTRLDDFRK